MAELKRLLKRGCQGDDVKELQRLLAAAGYEPGGIDGDFGPKTAGTVVLFQRAHDLVPDGLVGTFTWRALQSAGAFTLTQYRKETSAGGANCWHVAIRRDRMRPAYRLRMPQPSRWRVSEAARGYPLAINAGFFDMATGWPIGPTAFDGKAINDGPDYDSGGGWCEWATVVIEPELRLTHLHPQGVSALLARGARTAFSTIPRLIVDGKVDIGRADKHVSQRNPRAAIGWNEREIHLLVADGRSSHSAGLLLPELAEEILGFGCTSAAALDSGGSSELMVNGRIMNRPSDGWERPMPGVLAFELI